MPSRFPANPYRVTLDLDPLTSDALTQAAKAGQSTRHRLAYELVQRGLGLGAMTLPDAATAAPEPDPFTRSLQRGLADLDRLPPRRL